MRSAEIVSHFEGSRFGPIWLKLYENVPFGCRILSTNFRMDWSSLRSLRPFYKNVLISKISSLFFSFVFKVSEKTWYCPTV